VIRDIAGVSAGNVAFCNPTCSDIPVVNGNPRERCELHTGLYCVYRCVGKWAHGTGYETDQHVLVCRQVGQLWLLFMGEFL
jgi:hypothetical protein